MKKIFTKIKNYFTANLCRKIFFFGLLLAVLLFAGSYFLQLRFLRYFAFFCFIVAWGGTLGETMQDRAIFLRKVREMQYAHLQEMLEKQQADETVAVTTTFSESEKKYIKRKKRAFLWTIIFKVIILLCLFPLLFK